MSRLSRTTTTILNQALKSSRRQSLSARLLVALVSIMVLYWLVATSAQNQPADIPQPAPTPTLIPAGNYVVERVVDGDTLVVQVRSQPQTVRLIGIDTPEVVDPRQPVQCFGQEASAKLKELLHHRTVRLESDPTQQDQDQYNRWLRYVYLPDGTNVNLFMVQHGFAHEYTFRVPYLQQSQFKHAQQQARQQGLGLWSPVTCDGSR